MKTRKDLTDRAVRNLQPGYHACGRSLYAQVSPKGSRSWILRILVRGKRRELGLGSYPQVGLAQAHEEADRLRKIARSGGDPLAERTKAEIPTFEEAARTLHNEHKHGWRNLKHRAQWISTLERYVFPVFGALSVAEIDTSHVMAALGPIWLSKPETARRVRQRIGLVLDWAKAMKYRTGDNPADGIEKVLPKQPDIGRHHAAMLYIDVPGFVSRLRKASTSDAVKLAFEFLVLTAARTNEVLGARWDEIDLGERTWEIPGSRMKAKKSHRIPLPERPLEILEAAKKLGGKTHVFPTAGKDAPLSNMAMAMLLRRMGIRATVHGFRSAFKDWALETTNFANIVSEHALAHRLQDKAERAYSRTDLFDKRRKLMQTWGAYACSSGKVVKIRAA